MKAAILSDIHANLEALNAVLQDCEREGVDRFWLLGDYVDYGANPIEVVSRLAGLNAEYIVAGNHDACLYNSSVRHSVTPHGAQAFAYTKRIIGKNRGDLTNRQCILPSRSYCWHMGLQTIRTGANFCREQKMTGCSQIWSDWMSVRLS